MYRFLLTLLLTLAAGGVPRVAHAEPTAAVETRPFLWTLETDRATVHLLGSIHVARPDIYPLPAAMYRAFDASDSLVVEANPFAVPEAELAQRMMMRALRLEGPSYRELLDKETYEALAQTAERSGMTPAYLDRLKPWYVAQLVGLLEMKRLGIDPEHGIDRHFVARAGSDKPILELEGIEKQLNLLDSFSDKEQLLMLRYTLRDLENLEAHMDEITTAWKAGDAARLNDLLTGYLDESPGLEPIFDKLFKDRNREMAKRIRELIEKGGTYFVVVGAGHLVAEHGIIRSLESAGYEVKQAQ